MFHMWASAYKLVAYKPSERVARYYRFHYIKPTTIRFSFVFSSSIFFHIVDVVDEELEGRAIS